LGEKRKAACGQLAVIKICDYFSLPNVHTFALFSAKDVFSFRQKFGGKPDILDTAKLVQRNERHILVSNSIV